MTTLEEVFININNEINNPDEVTKNKSVISATSNQVSDYSSLYGKNINKSNGAITL